MLKHSRYQAVRFFSQAGMCWTIATTMISSGGRSRIAGIRKTFVAWYDWLRRDLDERDLCERGARREQQEREPDARAVRLRLQPGDERRREEPGEDRDRDQVRGGRDREPPVSARAPLRVVRRRELQRGRRSRRAHDRSPVPHVESLLIPVRSRRGKVAPCLKLRAVKRLGLPRPSEWRGRRNRPASPQTFWRSRASARVPGPPLPPPLPPASWPSECLPVDRPRRRPRPPR